MTSYINKLTESGLLNSSQSGFRSLQSTLTALLETDK